MINTPYSLGKQSFEDDYPRSANPYPDNGSREDLEDREWWFKGWDVAHDLQRNVT